MNWQLASKDVDIVICDRWINDVLVDISVDSRRPDLFHSRWYERFQRIVPNDAVQFLVIRNADYVLVCRPEYQDDPDFPHREMMYQKLQEMRDKVHVISNDGSIEKAVEEMLAHLDASARIAS